MKKLIFLMVCTFSVSLALGQGESASPVKWMTFEEAVEKSKTEKKKIFIDLYTDWCGWCKVMDKNTFTDPEVARVLNEKFYPVKFNAEQTADVVFRGTTFKFVPYGNNGSHQLAMALLNNQMSYPNFVFLDEEFRIVPIFQGSTSVSGYRKPDEFHVILSFVGTEFFKKGNLQDFQTKEYKSPYQAKAVTTSNGSGK